MSIPTYHRWKEQHGGAEKSTVKRLKEMEMENLRRKKLVAEQALNNAMLKDVAEGAEWSESDKGAAFARQVRQR